jgi:hypothetical protein
MVAWRARWFRLTLALALVGGEIVLVLPHLGHGTGGFTVRWPWVLAAVACEVASIATFTRLRRTLLRAGGLEVPLGRMGALTLASSAVNVTLPAGAAVSSAYLYKQLRRTGAGAPLAAWTLVAAGVVSGLSFTVLAMAGAVLSGGSSLTDILGAGGLGLAAVLGLVALLNLLTRRPEPILRALRALCRRRKAGCADATGESSLERTAAALAAIRPTWRDWLVAFLFATLNWVWDLACFVMCCYAVGIDSLGIGVAVLAYVAGLATTTLSLLPAGLGNVDAGLLAGLTHAGVAAPLAAGGILAYRLVAYALVAAVGWVVWAALRRRARHA